MRVVAAHRVAGRNEHLDRERGVHEGAVAKGRRLDAVAIDEPGHRERLVLRGDERNHAEGQGRLHELGHLHLPLSPRQASERLAVDGAVARRRRIDVHHTVERRHVDREAMLLPVIVVNLVRRRPLSDADEPPLGPCLELLDDARDLRLVPGDGFWRGAAPAGRCPIKRREPLGHCRWLTTVRQGERPGQTITSHHPIVDQTPACQQFAAPETPVDSNYRLRINHRNRRSYHLVEHDGQTEVAKGK